MTTTPRLLSCGDPTTSFQLLRPANALVPSHRETSQNIKQVTVLPVQRITYSVPCAGVDYTLWTSMLCVQWRTSVQQPACRLPRSTQPTRVTGTCSKKKNIHRVCRDFRHAPCCCLHCNFPPYCRWVCNFAIAGTWVGDWQSIFHTPVGHAQSTSRAP